jgi:Ca2+-dependent lipid-binding protein
MSNVKEEEYPPSSYNTSTRTRKDSTSSNLRSRISLSLRRNVGKGSKEKDGSDNVTGYTEGQSVRQSTSIHRGELGKRSSLNGNGQESNSSNDVSIQQGKQPLTPTATNGEESAKGSNSDSQGDPRSAHKRTISNVSKKHRKNQSDAPTMSAVTEYQSVPRQNHQPIIVDNPLRSVMPKITQFFVISAFCSIVLTRFVHWILALLLVFILAYVLRTQLQIAADDSEWTKAESARITQQESDEKNSESVEWMNAVLKNKCPELYMDAEWKI